MRGDGREGVDAGQVDEDVDFGVLCDEGRDHGLDFGFVCQVADVEGGFVALIVEVCANSFEFGFVDVDEDDKGALCCEHCCGDLADALCGSSHEDVGSFEFVWISTDGRDVGAGLLEDRVFCGHDEQLRKMTVE